MLKKANFVWRRGFGLDPIQLEEHKTLVKPIVSWRGVNPSQSLPSSTPTASHSRSPLLNMDTFTTGFTCVYVLSVRFYCSFVASMCVCHVENNNASKQTSLFTKINKRVLGLVINNKLTNLSITIHITQQKIPWRFDLYQRPSSEESGTNSSSAGSWHGWRSSRQDSGRACMTELVVALTLIYKWNPKHNGLLREINVGLQPAQQIIINPLPLTTTTTTTTTTHSCLPQIFFLS